MVTSAARNGPVSYIDSWLILGMYKNDDEAVSTDGTLDGPGRRWNA
jgi:hypothetical protein